MQQNSSSLDHGRASPLQKPRFPLRRQTYAFRGLWGQENRSSPVKPGEENCIYCEKPIQEETARKVGACFHFTHNNCFHLHLSNVLNPYGASIDKKNADSVIGRKPVSIFCPSSGCPAILGRLDFGWATITKDGKPRFIFNDAAQ